jgi:hypothetical protein
MLFWKIGERAGPSTMDWPQNMAVMIVLFAAYLISFFTRVIVPAWRCSRVWLFPSAADSIQHLLGLCRGHQPVGLKKARPISGC